MEPVKDSEKKGGKIFITGCAGFIGFHLSRRLLEEGFDVLGIDNLNDYYEVQLKNDRLNLLLAYKKFTFIRGSIENKELMESIFNQFDIKIVLHFAAQAGVRYSLTNPHTYIQSNLVGFANVVECCKKAQIQHLIYASSSSVYGGNTKIPFSESDPVDQPISLYGATKRANELMAYTYSHLYGLPTTGLRLFTVYGPWGRPDMAAFLFTDAIVKQKPIEMYNYGRMKRDFTYIDDVIESVYRVIVKNPTKDVQPPCKIYNIGNHQPIELKDFVQVIEGNLGKKAVKKFLPLQSGDVQETFANLDELSVDIEYRPKVPIQVGLKKFIEWYKNYYKDEK